MESTVAHIDAPLFCMATSVDITAPVDVTCVVASSNAHAVIHDVPATTTAEAESEAVEEAVAEATEGAVAAAADAITRVAPVGHVTRRARCVDPDDANEHAIKRARQQPLCEVGSAQRGTSDTDLTSAHLSSSSSSSALELQKNSSSSDRKGADLDKREIGGDEHVTNDGGDTDSSVYRARLRVFHACTALAEHPRMFQCRTHTWIQDAQTGVWMRMSVLMSALLLRAYERGVACASQLDLVHALVRDHISSMPGRSVSTTASVQWQWYGWLCGHRWVPWHVHHALAPPVSHAAFPDHERAWWRLMSTRTRDEETRVATSATAIVAGSATVGAADCIATQCGTTLDISDLKHTSTVWKTYELGRMQNMLACGVPTLGPPLATFEASEDEAALAYVAVSTNTLFATAPAATAADPAADPVSATAARVPPETTGDEYSEAIEQFLEASCTDEKMHIMCALIEYVFDREHLAPRGSAALVPSMATAAATTRTAAQPLDVGGAKGVKGNFNSYVAAATATATCSTPPNHTAEVVLAHVHRNDSREYASAIDTLRTMGDAILSSARPTLSGQSETATKQEAAENEEMRNDSSLLPCLILVGEMARNLSAWLAQILGVQCVGVHLTPRQHVFAYDRYANSESAVVWCSVPVARELGDEVRVARPRRSSLHVQPRAMLVYAHDATEAYGLVTQLASQRRYWITCVRTPALPKSIGISAPASSSTASSLLSSPSSPSLLPLSSNMPRVRASPACLLLRRLRLWRDVYASACAADAHLASCSHVPIDTCVRVWHTHTAALVEARLPTVISTLVCAYLRPVVSSVETARQAPSPSDAQVASSRASATTIAAPSAHEEAYASLQWMCGALVRRAHYIA